ncbi:MAG: YerC/YecD family TrpR-related protein, partial [Collinsella sp.]|nr:YerC/YecD family TrpR-related protein [Collinsella sp.]
LLDDEKDIQAFLTDICTPREICDLSQRLQVARYLDEGEPYVEVQVRTGASSTTVSRVSKALNGEYGGYRKILIKLEDGE